MTATGEQSLRWWPVEKAAVATPDVEALVARYSGLLYRVAFSVLRNTAEAEDVVQDAFLRVVERPESLAQVREMRPWLVKIAWNLALDRRRKARPEQMEAEFIEGLIGKDRAADEALLAMQEVGEVLRELERLPRAERDALLLSAVEELGTAEVAKVLGRSESAVRALLFRGRMRLRERLESRRSGL